METPGKVKKILTAEMLQNLALAREKARIKRTEMGELTKLKKQLAEKTKQDEIKDIKMKLGVEPEPESEEEPENPVPEKVIKPKKKTKKPIVIVEDSESDSEEDSVVYIRRKSSKIKPHQILHEEELIDEPVPVPVAPVRVSPYHGMHPSMLSRGRR
jgi:hypothetical protein